MALRPHPLETLFTALAGWLPLLGGLTLLAMTLITPEWVGWRDLLWQRDMLRLQAQSLETQRDSYAAFHDALSADDPVLLERLAFTQLRYKPAGKHLMDDLWLVSGSGAEVAGPSNMAYAAAGPSEVIESWLASPQPVIGKDIRPLKRMNTRLTRLTGGFGRYVLLAVAILCLIASLWPEKPDQEEEREAVGPVPGTSTSRYHPRAA